MSQVYIYWAEKWQVNTLEVDMWTWTLPLQVLLSTCTICYIYLEPMSLLEYPRIEIIPIIASLMRHSSKENQSFRHWIFWKVKDSCSDWIVMTLIFEIVPNFRFCFHFKELVNLIFKGFMDSRWIHYYLHLNDIRVNIAKRKRIDDVPAKTFCLLILKVT